MTEYFDYINNKLCVAARWLFTEELGGGVMTRDTYKKLVTRKRINVMAPGKGRGNMAMVEYESLNDYKTNIKARLGCDPRDLLKDSKLRGYLTADNAALKYFADYTYGEPGCEKNLPIDVQYEYYANAVVLNAVRCFLANKRQIRQLVGETLKKPWEILAESVTGLDALKSSDGKRLYPHSLSDNDRVLHRQYDKYNQGNKNNYDALIHKNYGNQSARVVTEQVESLLLSICAMETKPYMTSKYDYVNSVHGIYLQFMGGGIRLVNAETGELFDRANFCDKKGNPVIVSKSTVQNYIKKLENSNALEKVRNSELNWNSKWRPIHHRHAPEYSFSKLTMDDIAIPFKRPDGTRVWAYQVFDTLSTCVVGRSYSKDKGVDMLIDSLKDMMKLCIRNQWGFPGEIECEQHLANTLTGKTDDEGNFEEDLLTAGTLFPFVSFQRGGMPQGKRAEGFIKTKKYNEQAKRKGFQRRPFSRLEANRLNTDKNNVRYTLKEIVANEEIDINNYNNSLHPDQERFPNKTRWQVLIENINPNLTMHSMPVLAYYLGECRTDALVHRSQWVRVNKKDYALPSPTIIKRLKSLTVHTYYIDGMNEVHIYQDGRFICTCREVETYNEAKIERTADDEAIILNYEKNVARFDKMTRETKERFTKLEIIRAEETATILDTQPEGNSPVHGEFDEPDLEQQKQEKRDFRKAERQRDKANKNTREAFFDLIKNNTDFGD